MKLKTFSSFFIFITILIISDFSFGQKFEKIISTNDSTATFEIRLKNGSVFYGNIISHDQFEIIFSTDEIPSFSIERIKIKSIEQIDDLNQKRGEYWFPNPNSSRYFVGSSAFGLKKGEGYYQNIYVFINSVNYGLTDYFSIGGGFESVSLFVGQLPGFFITPKINIPISKKLKTAAGVMVIGYKAPDEEMQGLGIGYGIVSYGSRDHNISGGIGFGWNSQNFSETPVFTLSGMTRISRKVSLVSENWLLTNFDSGSIYSYGIRIMGEKMSVDLGFWTNSDIAQEIFLGIPYVDFTVKF
ncbi:MAG: hypothetical protein KTR26_17610 [Flammeovirgaceae bacterium]|nr:hypothetical protein [Flammeovirgaceae bacterium]